MLERFRTVSSGAQVLIVLTGIVLASAVMVALWYMVLRVPYAPVFSQLDAPEAAAVVGELEKDKTPYRLADGGRTILVPADKVDATRLDIAGRDIPLRGAVGFELFNESDMGRTDFAQKINYQRALQGELARTIMTLVGVDSARVHLSLGEDRIFRTDRVPPKASVSIRMENHAEVQAGTALGVQRLVAAAVPKLDAANVVILDERGTTVTAPQSAAPVEGPSDRDSSETAALEQFYRIQIEKALERLYPPGTVAVSVAATILPEEVAGKVQNWTPTTRDFPLRVTLATPVALDQASQADARAVVTAAIGVVPGVSDAVAFTQMAPAPDPVASVSRSSDAGIAPAQPDAIAPDQQGGASISTGALILMGGIALALLAALLRRRAPDTRMTAREKDDFAEKLQNALRERRDHASS